MFPEVSVAGGEECVLAGVPAEEMGRVGVLGVGVAGLPNFVEQEGAGRVKGAVQVVAEAAFFFSSGTNQGAQFRFEDCFLAFARAQHNN